MSLNLVGSFLELILEWVRIPTNSTMFAGVISWFVGRVEIFGNW